jgi:Chaperone of endosialidase
MSSLPLIRTEYWNVGTGTIRTGATAHGESVTDMEQYLLPLSQMTASGLYSWGVIEGLAVTAVTGQPGVTVAPGLAVDLSGRVIALASDGSAVTDPAADPSQIQNITTVQVGADGVTLATDGLSGDFLLTLTWLEALGQSQLGNAPVLIHAPWLRLPAAAGFQAAGDQVILAQVSLDAQGSVTALATGATLTDGTAGPGRQTSATHAAGYALQVPRLTAPATGPAVDDAVAGGIVVTGTGAVRVEVAGPAGVLELAAGQGAGSGVSALADRLTVRSAADTTGTLAIALDATDSSVTAGELRLGGTQSGVQLSTGPAAGVLAATAARLTVQSTDGTIRISLDGETSTVSADSVLIGGAVSVTTAPAGALTLSAPAGQVQLGVGTAAPFSALGVRGLGSSQELLSFEDDAGTTRWHMNQNLAGRPGLNFAETGVADARLYLQPGGHVGIGTATPAFDLDVNGTVCARQFCNPSDLRLKQDVTPLGGVLDGLAGIRAVSYRPAWPAAPAEPAPQIGVLAQDVQAAFPELVVAMEPDGLLAVDYAGLAGVLLKAVQELQASNDDLARRLGEVERQGAS